MSKNRVMLIDECTYTADILVQSLKSSGYDVIGRAKCTDNFLALCEKLDPDIIVVDLEKPDRSILEQLSLINTALPKPIVMFSENTEDTMIQAVVKAGISAFVVDGFNANRIKPVISVAIARFEELQALYKELKSTKASLESRKFTDRAKGILMKQRNCSENDAYAILRKMAMDRNVSIVDVSKNIIEVSVVLEY